jgi:predicted nucleic acid-binding protein
MKYVLDSSVALKWVLAEADSARAIRLRDEYVKGVHDLLAPDLFTPEIGNALVVAERGRRIKPGEAAVFLKNILGAAPVFYPSAASLIRAMEMALTTKHAVYDCLYVALAEREGCEFVTADDKLMKALRPSFPFITSLASVP